MKKLKYLLIVLTGFIALNTATAQTKQEKKAAKIAEVKKLVDGHHFVFTAQYANPLRGGHRYLTSDYDITVKKDSVIAYLPYFGRAYFDVPYNPTDGGIKFTSTDFTYTATEKKKGGWDITVMPKDVKNIRQLTFYISPDGASSSVRITITNKDAISFDGYADSGKKK